MHEGHSHHGDEPGKELVLLSYMTDHNRHHAEELKALAQKLEQLGKGEAAGLIDKALTHFDEGNGLLCAALELLEQNTEGGGK